MKKSNNALQDISNNTIMPVVITGSDIGNDSTKTDKGVFFPSQVYEGDADLDFNSLAIKVRWRERIFIVGDYEKGVTFEKIDKIDKDLYTVALLTSIALSHPSKKQINTILSIGLPYDFYSNKEVKQYYYEKTLELGEQELDIFIDNNKALKYKINIVDVVVNAQGAVLEQMSTDKLPATVVDFGGGTLDMTKWFMSSKTKLLNVDENYEDNKNSMNSLELMGIGKSDTNLGFNDVLDSVIKDLDSKGKKFNSRQELISVLDKSELKRLGKDPINLDRVKNTYFTMFSKRVSAFLENNNVFDSECLFFIGGCAEIMKPFVAKELDIAQEFITVLPNARFFNAKNYAIRAEKLLDKTKYVLEDKLM